MEITGNKAKSGMRYRNALEEDVPDILGVISQARQSIKKLGIDQWQDGYPDAEVFLKDIRCGQCYVFEADNEVAGVMVLAFMPEDAYEKIEGTGWLNNSRNYAVIHRMAVGDAFRGSGLSGKMIEIATKIGGENGVVSLRADTHRGNLPMQKFLTKSGFTYCGNVIYPLIHGDKIRMAYEKIISAGVDV